MEFTHIESKGESRDVQQKIHVEGAGIHRVALAQIACDEGRIDENVERILRALDIAREDNADVVVFPELTIPGYSAMDLFYNKDFLAKNREALRTIIENSHGLSVIVGFVDEVEEKDAPGGKPWIYNAAAFIHDGKLAYVQHKELLPTYGVFSEKRYFQPGKSRAVIEMGDTKFGIAICEDIWAAENAKDIPAELRSLGADLIFTLNASPFNEGKVAARTEVLESAARNNGVTLVYCNLIGSQDGYDGEVIFDGRSQVFNDNGEIIASFSPFRESIDVVDLDDVSPLTSAPSESIEDLHSALVLGIKDFFRKKNCTTAYIGLSGGIDSALVAALAVEALGAENVKGVTMPSHITSDETKSDAFLLAEYLGISCVERPIVDEYNAWLAQARIAHGHEPQSLTKQNKQARIRETILMEYTNEDRGALLLNTGNKTEIALGYFTLYGDSAGAVSVLGDVDKLKVYELSKFINERAGRELIPVTTIDRPPTAELEEGQTDENSLSAGYDVLVPLVNDAVENNHSFEKLCKKYPESVVSKVLYLIRINEGKRRQLPPAIRVTRKAFGLERRIPMDHRN